MCLLQNDVCLTRIDLAFAYGNKGNLKTTTYWLGEQSMLLLSVNASWLRLPIISHTFEGFGTSEIKTAEPLQ